MALSDDDFIQQNTGFATASTAVTVSLSSGTTAGNTVLVFFYSAGSTTTPSGFIQDATAASAPGIYRRSNVPASETSWVFTTTAADAAWVALEVANLDLVEPVDASVLSSMDGSINNAETHSTGTTPFGVCLSTIQFAVFLAAHSGASSSWGSYTNGFQDLVQVAAADNNPLVAVAWNSYSGSTAQFTTTATFTVTGGVGQAVARLFSYREKNTPIAAQLALHTGWEFGTHGGMGDVVHSPGFAGPVCLLGVTTAPVGTWGTHYLVQAGSARSGAYGLRYAVSGAICNIPTAPSGVHAGTFGRSIKVVSGSGIAVVSTVDSSATDLELVYDFSTNQYGLRWGSGGTVSYQSGTTALDTWVWVEVRYKVNATTHSSNWRLETDTDTYTEQTAPADLTGQVSSTVTKVVIGGLASQTLTMDVDDVVGSAYYGAYPLGPHEVVLLKVDPAGTPTVSGTSGNFNVFTANGTLAAWNATNARDAVDEVPPTVSASADGVVQVTLAASDYMEFPMQTYTLAADEVIAGVRIVAALWDGTGTGTGTLAIKGWDGVAAFDAIPLASLGTYDANAPTAIASADPWWAAGQWLNSWTQAKLDAACVRVGYSGDATPDKGVSAIYLEVAVKKIPPAVVVHRLTSDEDPEAVAAVVTERLHPNNSGVRVYTVSNGDADRTVKLDYSIGGTPQTPVVVDPGDPPVDVLVAAEAFGEVDSTSFGWQ